MTRPVRRPLARWPRVLLCGVICGGLLACGKPPESASPPVTADNPYSVPFDSPAYLREHAKYLEEAVLRIGDTPVWDYNTPNRGFGNVIMIEGNDGLIIVDTTTALEHAEVAAEAFREISDKPVRAIIYTHHHADHIGGAAAFIDATQAGDESVAVIASARFPRELQDENRIVAPIMGLRALYMYGQLLDPEGDGRDYHVSCCGYRIAGDGRGFIPPNRLIEGREQLTIAGVDLQFFPTGGESASHMAIYLPEFDVLLSGDELQGPNYPNLHSLRGTKPRDAIAWVQAIDRMRDYYPEHLVPSHGQPLSGREHIAEVLLTYRDAIQYTHDQAIRWINKGYTADELAQTIRLPGYLSIEPWTREMYGTVAHSVREFFVQYISWWNGDPAELDPLPRVEKASRLVALMGGRDRVFGVAELAFRDGDDQWAAELSAYLVRIDRDDMPARQLKAAALRRIGFATANTNWRGFYLSAARELEGSLVPRDIVQEMQTRRFDPATLSTMQLFDLLRYRVDAKAIGNSRVTVAYRLRDSQEAFTLELRNSILVIHEQLLDDVDILLTLDRPLLDRLFTQDISYREAIDQGLLDTEGSLLALRRFGRAFDRDPGQPFQSLR